jgi:two-component system nitrogen regulation sensor histidine kinase NtrY
MLALLCASLLFTSIIVEKTYTPANNLLQTGKTLEHNLQEKEAAVNTLLRNKSSYGRLKELSRNPSAALKFIGDFTTNKNIWFITEDKDSLTFWSGVKVIPETTSAIKEGYSFMKEPNGYYEVIKKSEKDFSAIFFIPVRLDYAFENQYLKNTFSTDLLKDNNVEIADFTEKNVYEIHSTNGTYLFSVKLKPGEVNLGFLYYELSIWILTVLCLCILINNICTYIADRGHVLLSFLALSAFIVLLRFVNLYFGWPDFTGKLAVFNPELYASSPFYPSLGDLCINIVLISWLAVFAYVQRKRIIKQQTGQFAGYVIFIAGVGGLIGISTSLVSLFNGLVINSKISFDISNVLNLSGFSVLGVLMLCFSFLVFYLLVEVFLSVAIKLPIPYQQKIWLFISGIIIATIIYALHNGFSLFYVLWGLLVLVRGHAYRHRGGVLDMATLAIIVMVCSLISSIKLNNFESVKEKSSRNEFIQKLEKPDDPTAEINFKRIEKQIIQDTSIYQYFDDSLHNTDFLKTRLQKLYLNGYLTRYDFKTYVFGNHDQPLSADKSFELSNFKDMVLYSSYNKVSDYFYRDNQSFGFLSYFGILPIKQNGEKTGTIVIALKTKPLQTEVSFPGLLVDGELNAENDLKDYSYAYYTDGNLSNKGGTYNYDLVNTGLGGEVGKYVFKTTRYNGDKWYKGLSTFSHLIYKPNVRDMIVVSREENPLYFNVTAVTFFFVVFLAFAILVISVRWLWQRIRILTIKNDRIRWNFKINFDLVLYKTRIQFSMVFAVVTTLILVGFITFFSISTEFQSQQEKTIRDKVNKIASAFQSGQYSKYLSNVSEQTQLDFDDFANAYSVDLTLFDLKGIELITTQPKIYDFGLQGRRMNARAFVNLRSLQKSEFANDEKIGLLSYKAAFVPLRNSSAGKTVAYLELPYFSNESDYKERVGSLLNIMINVYAIVFMAIGLFAVFIAGQITSPLSFIQHSLSKTVYGKKNEPINWDRNDEIGALVKEYNKMIAALEASAQKLAQSERESAWREMAKQVAHEIKNPLTPLKLGLQLLDKSWKDKDPKFDQKFERFSKSFVEQIESLSSIASEFSAFAKMPETRLERLNIFGILSQAVTIFKEMDNIKIVYNAPETPFFINADRDQLLRCFNNLLKNAIEATRPGKMGLIEINFLITAKNMLLTIKDNGEGIAEGLRDKIFEPNFTTKSSGTGLGLAFVKNSIENADGKVWFETVLGEGTTFYISLPAA